MGWESKLAGYTEVPGSDDPIVFKYPARSTSAVILAISGVILAFGWGFSRELPILFAPMLVGGVGFAGFGFWQLLVIRRIELHRAARKLVEIRRIPFGKGRLRVVAFDGIRRITVTRGVDSESGDVHDTLVVELKDGGHVDFGNYTGPHGGVMAARLQEVIRASVVSQPKI